MYKENTIDPKLISKLLLNEGQEILINTSGPSMGYPVGHNKSVIVKKVPEDKIKFGDIIVFERKNDFVCHRIVLILKKKEGKYYTPKGDLLFSFDKPIKYQDIRGKVIRIKRPNGDLIMDLYWMRLLNIIVGMGSLSVGFIYNAFHFKGLFKITVKIVSAFLVFLLSLLLV